MVSPQLILAPMEGLADALMRDTLTRIGGIDRCVTEFVRVSDRVLPARVFRRLCPELLTSAKTSVGVPVHLQLLGSEPDLLARSAQRAVRLGATAIDLNFGCPAKTVNRSQGGSILLRDPAGVEAIVAAVRKALPEAIPLSAKMRLGYDDCGLMIENALAIQAGGACELCVHGRTKVQGYGGSADWAAIGAIRSKLRITVVANGDVCSVEDYWRCRELSGCDHVMLGRGLVSQPDLARQIGAALRGEAYQPLTWAELKPFVAAFYDQVPLQCSLKHAPGRLKQWLAMLAKNYPHAGTLFRQVRTLTDSNQIRALLALPPAG